MKENDNNSETANIYCVLIMCQALKLCLLFCTMTTLSRYYYYSHCIHEKMETWKGQWGPGTMQLESQNRAVDAMVPGTRCVQKGGP